MQIFTGNKEELFSKVTFHEPKQQVTVHRCTLFLAHGTNTARAEGIFELPLPRPCYCSGRTAADAGPSCKLGRWQRPVMVHGFVTTPAVHCVLESGGGQEAQQACMIHAAVQLQG